MSWKWKSEPYKIKSNAGIESKTFLCSFNRKFHPTTFSLKTSGHLGQTLWDVLNTLTVEKKTPVLSYTKYLLDQKEIGLYEYLKVEDSGIARFEILAAGDHPGHHIMVQRERGDGRQEPAVPWEREKEKPQNSNGSNCMYIFIWYIAIFSTCDILQYHRCTIQYHHCTIQYHHWTIVQFSKQPNDICLLRFCLFGLGNIMSIWDRQSCNFQLNKFFLKNHDGHNSIMSNNVLSKQ